MIGHWKGYYKFEKERIQKMIGLEKNYFEITIEKFDGVNFSGRSRRIVLVHYLLFF